MGNANTKMGEPTAQELVDICTNFMLTAPPGEFMEVVTDIRGLLSNEALLNSSAPATFRQYNQEQMLIAQSPAGHNFLITEYGEVGDGQYVDPRGKMVVKFDHIKQQVVGQGGAAQLDAGIESMRAAVDDAVQAYIVDHYPDGASTVYGKGKTITICIQSSKYNPANFYNGRWRGVYQCTIGGDVQVKGNIKIQVHYYEDGNVQLNSDTNKAFKVAAGDPATTAKAIVDGIKKIEKALQSAIEVTYATMGEGSFKALRRALPLTRSKIDWNKIKSYKTNLGAK